MVCGVVEPVFGGGDERAGVRGKVCFFSLEVFAHEEKDEADEDAERAFDEE